ncbi:MAG: response regulator [Halomonas subglaciescola]|nr:response regulator [Halomonas subglaciescola]
MYAPDSLLILVVEDEKALRSDIAEELEEAGYRVLAAADGQQALDFLADTTPDLLLCDITMPVLDGYQLLNILRRQHPELAATPFVFLTALSEPRKVIDGKLSGADDYLIKPIDYDLMLATIEAHLRQVKRIRRRHDDEITTLRSAVSGLSGGGAEHALDLITLGIVLLGEQGKLVHANRAAHEMANDADLIRISTAGIRALDSRSNRTLRQAIADTLAAAQNAEEKVAGVMLQQVQDNSSTSVLACAIPQTESSLSRNPHVALFLSASGRRKRAPETLLMELFDLTPTEARVAGALASSARASDVAAELGVSQTTIAFHMRNLFRKTDTHRQADLIALILAGPMMCRVPDD